MKKIIPFALATTLIVSSCSWWGTSTPTEQPAKIETGAIQNESGVITPPVPTDVIAPPAVIATGTTQPIIATGTTSQSTGATIPTRKTNPASNTFSGEITPFVNDIPINISWSTNDISTGSMGDAEVDEALKEISSLLNDISGSTTTGSTKK